MAIKRNTPSWNKKPILAEFNFNDSQKLSGIYRITNKDNNKQYIGSTICFNDRWLSHIRDLKKKIHHNIPLQNSYNIHGEDKFRFDVIELFSGTDEELRSKEQEYLDWLFLPENSSIKYNTNKKACGPGKNPPRSIDNPTSAKTDSVLWFLSPEGIEHVVHSTEELCKKYDLNLLEIDSLVLLSKTSNKEEQLLNGWKILLKPVTPIVLVNKVTAEQYTYVSGYRFSKIHNLQQSHLVKLVSGKRKSCGDWSVLNRIYIPKPYKVLKGIHPSNKGWTVELTSLDQI